MNVQLVTVLRTRIRSASISLCQFVKTFLVVVTCSNEYNQRQISLLRRALHSYNTDFKVSFL